MRELHAVAASSSVAAVPVVQSCAMVAVELSWNIGSVLPYQLCTGENCAE